MCIRRQRNVPALLHIGINQPADDWHQSHRQLQQMQHVSFSFNNDNNEKEKNNIYYICFFVLLIIFIIYKLLN